MAPIAAAVIMLAASSGVAQQPAPSEPQAAPRPDSTAAARDSVAIADIEKAAEQLAIAVRAAVKKATEDPALKMAALKVATNAVTAAQVIVTQQVETLQAILDAMSREIAAATEKQKARPKSH